MNKEIIWDDSSDKIFDIMDMVEDDKSTQTPIKCPICERNAAHLYMHRWENDKGTIWVWCSKCKACAHGSFMLPKWWENAEFIAESELTSHPVFLNDKAELLDDHLKSLLGKRSNL